MLRIPCPWCGPRDETEFAYGSQAHIAYPVDPSTVDDAAWAAYLFFRDNPRGWFAERWMHRAGCQRWFNVIRHTVTYEIAASYPPGAAGPGADALSAAEAPIGHRA